MCRCNGGRRFTLYLLSASVGAFRFNFKVGRIPPQKSGWDHPLTSESSALLDTTNIKSAECDGNILWKSGIRWKSGPFLGAGCGGTIMQVTTSNTDMSKQYAMKMPSGDINCGAAQVIHKEAQIMKETTERFWTGRYPECQHVAPLFDSTPCLDDVLIKGAYVSLKMEVDLQGWYNRYAHRNEHIQKECRGSIAQQLADGLRCLHIAGKHGYMHGDVKMDNILVESIDPVTFCPEGLRLIDFGHSHARGSRVPKHSEEYFSTSRHLPDSVFQDASDSLFLTVESNPDMFYASSQVDWCSFAYLMNSNFNYIPLMHASNNDARVIMCGKMGKGRHLVDAQTRSGKYVLDGQVEFVSWVAQPA